MKFTDKKKASRMGFGQSIHKHSRLQQILKIFLYLAEYAWIGLQCAWLSLRKNKYTQLVDERIKHQIDKGKSTFSFLRALMLNPGATGAILPSSKWLAKTMASFISVPNDTLIVELGAGTGVITEAILATGIAPENLIVVENAPHLAKKLKSRFPQIKVIEGDAAELTVLLKEESQLVSSVVSSLPLRSLPDQTKQEILSEIPSILSKNGQYIQFTYDITNYKNIYPDNYHLSRTTIVWRNIPPAKVGVYVLNKAESEHK